MLKFSRGNAKLDKLEKKIKGQVWTFSLLSGHTCPYAKDCHSRAIEGDNGKLHVEDGQHTLFRCFSASQEAFFKNVYKSRKDNWQIIKYFLGEIDGINKLATAIAAGIPKKCKAMRIHVGGDFFVQAYFDAWLEAAKLRPDIVFYAYTKSLPFWVKRINEIPANFVLTASYGGYKDNLIAEYKLRYAKVVYSKQAAKQEGLPIDHDDSHAYRPVGNFALLVHGIQPKGSEAREAMKALGGLGGKSSYQRK